MNLNNFIGTTQYHKLTMGPLKFTEGMAYLADKGECFWLMDIVGSVQHLTKIQNNDFIVWRVIQSQSGDGCRVQAYSDSEADGSYSPDKLLYSQSIGYTTFPFEELGDLEFYQEGEVVLLKSEH